jgi:putative membrane protein
MQRIAGLALILISAAWSLALATEMRSGEFISEAIEGNLFELRAGELAQAKAERETVRQFGAILAKDHANAAGKSQQAAMSVGAKIPTEPSAAQRDVLDALGKLNGVKFDQYFIKAMRDDHLRDVARYETQAKGKDAVGKYAAETLPHLRDHLQAVQGLQNERATQ